MGDLGSCKNQESALFIDQCAKKVVSDSARLVDFAIGLVISIINLPDGQMKLFGVNSNYRRTVTSAHQNFFRAI